MLLELSLQFFDSPLLFRIHLLSSRLLRSEWNQVMYYGDAYCRAHVLIRIMRWRISRKQLSLPSCSKLWGGMGDGRC